MTVSRGKFQCKTCTWGRHCDESNPAPFRQWKIEGVIESATCLLPMVTSRSWLLLRLHGHYQNHILPFGGGLFDQPNAYIRAMEIIDEAIRADANR